MEASSAAIARLQALIGEWHIEVAFPDARPRRCERDVRVDRSAGATCCSARTFPIPTRRTASRSSASIPRAATDIQHYFDSRGVTRVYAMTLRDNEWTLLREHHSPARLRAALRGEHQRGSPHDRGLLGATGGRAGLAARLCNDLQARLSAVLQGWGRKACCCRRAPGSPGVTARRPALQGAPVG